MMRTPLPYQSLVLGIACCAAFLVGVAPLHAQDVRVQATVNGTTIGENEAVVYSIEIEGADMSDVRTPQPPEAENLALQQSIPNTSRSVSIINGRMSQSVTFRWTYLPRGVGSATIASTSVQVGDRRLVTDPIRLNIVPQSQRPQQPPTARRTPFGQQSAPSQPTIADGDLFIRAVPSKRQAYINEQVTIEYHLYGRDYIQLRQSRLTDSWDAEGFWREDLEVDTRPVPRAVVENGLRYNVIVLKRVAVFPTRAGNLTIDPLQIETEVYVPGRSSDPFSAFFPSTNFQPVRLNSPAVVIDVRPLPAGAPDAFAGAVGRYRMEASMDRHEVEVGESVQIEMRLTGSGNLATLAPPALEAPGIFEQYDPQINTTIDRSGRSIQGTKTVTHVLVPRSNGTVEVPEIEFVYFDPALASYERIVARTGTLHVTGSATPSAASATRGGLPVDDIAGIKTGEVEWQQTGGRPLHEHTWPFLAIMLPILAVGGVAVYQRRASRLSTDLTYARSRRAHPLAKKHLREAENLLKQNDARAFYAEIERALLAFVGNKLDIPEVGLTRQQLDAQLRANAIGDDVRGELYRLLDESEQAQFAPVPPDREAMETAIERASRTIIAIGEREKQSVRAGA